MSVESVAEEFERRASDLGSRARAFDKNSQEAAALRGKARGYHEAATTLRSRLGGNDR